SATLPRSVEKSLKPIGLKSFTYNPPPPLYTSSHPKLFTNSIKLPDFTSVTKKPKLLVLLNQLKRCGLLYSSKCELPAEKTPIDEVGSMKLALLILKILPDHLARRLVTCVANWFA